MGSFWESWPFSEGFFKRIFKKFQFSSHLELVEDSFGIFLTSHWNLPGSHCKWLNLVLFHFRGSFRDSPRISDGFWKRWLKDVICFFTFASFVSSFNFFFLSIFTISYFRFCFRRLFLQLFPCSVRTGFEFVGSIDGFFLLFCGFLLPKHQEGRGGKGGNGGGGKGDSWRCFKRTIWAGFLRFLQMLD